MYFKKNTLNDILIINNRVVGVLVVKKKKSNKNNKCNTLVKYFFIFFTCCLIGWIYEEVYYLIDRGKLINSGFLYGPYLPVYGVGGIFIYMFTNKYKKNPVIIFILSFVIAGIVEYLTGHILWQIFHRRWWDYTGFFLNVDGYICLMSLSIFAVAALFLIYLVIPNLEKLLKKLGNEKGKYISIIISIIIIIDFIITITHRY